MSYFDVIFTLSNEIFKPFLLVVSSTFAIYFAYKKIGNRVTAQYSFGCEGFTPSRIKEVVLSNKKDKPVNIYAIHAVFHNDLLLELDKYSPPKVLKPYESLSLSMSPYSSLNVGSDKYKPDFMSAEIYIESDDKVIKCKSRYRPELLGKYAKVSVNICSYNGFVYDETVAYILVYVLDNCMKTAFIHKSGYIGNEWELSPNHLGQNATDQNVLGMIVAHKFDKFFSFHVIYRVLSLGKLEAVKA
ncbi:hypothetical protein WN093_03480 [Gammaproteobacteria bacterium AS21]